MVRKVFGSYGYGSNFYDANIWTYFALNMTTNEQDLTNRDSVSPFLS